MPEYAKFAKYRSFSGWKVSAGGDPVRCNTSRTMGRVIELTAALEAPNFGVVQSYDGCGVSAGILHHTATFPGKATLGGFWSLLVDIEHDTGIDLDPDLFPSAPVRLKNKVLDGNGARAYFTGSPAGITAEGNKKIRERIVALANLFANPLTYDAQIHAAEKFLATTSVRRLMHGDARSLYFKSDRGGVVLGSDPVPTDFLSYEHLFAYCVAQSFAVNNPKAALDTVALYVAKKVDPTSEAAYGKMIAARPNWYARGHNLLSAAGKSGRWSQGEFEMLAKALRKAARV